MYAIIEDGSRQYRMEPGALVVIDYRAVKPGETLELTKVLLYQSGAETLIGKPVIEGARVITQVVELPKTKTMTQKFRRRKASKRLKGHTQPYVRVKVQHILKAGEAIPVPAPEPTSAPTPEPAPIPAPVAVSPPATEPTPAPAPATS